MQTNGRTRSPRQLKFFGGRGKPNESDGSSRGCRQAQEGGGGPRSEQLRAQPRAGAARLAPGTQGTRQRASQAALQRRAFATTGGAPAPRRPWRAPGPGVDPAAHCQPGIAARDGNKARLAARRGLAASAAMRRKHACSSHVRAQGRGAAAAVAHVSSASAGLLILGTSRFLMWPATGMAGVTRSAS